MSFSFSDNEGHQPGEFSLSTRRCFTRTHQ